MEFTRVRCDDLPLEVIDALALLMEACCKTFPDPADAPQPLRDALGRAIDLWLQAIDEADDDEPEGGDAG